MAPLLGKRKRRAHLVDENNILNTNDESSDFSRLQEILQKAFESEFEPLSVVEIKTAKSGHEAIAIEEAGESSEWEGISNGEEDAKAIVDYTSSTPIKRDLSRDELRSFMSAKPPGVTAAIKPKHPAAVTAEDATNDAANLKKDLALQRLLKESHLLDDHSTFSHTGKTRHKALDLRLQDMGSKSSIFSQQKMPLAQRKGIAAKAADRQETRRREAQENGVILEKVGPAKKKHDGKRERGIGAPSVGKFRGGTLQLSKKDVAQINGPRKTSRSRR